MEQEKKTKTRKKANTTTGPLGTAETTEPKKTATKKKERTTGMSTNGSAPKKTAAPRKRVNSKLTQMISHEEIARLAHRYWAERGHQHGHHEEDWLRAERELLGKAS